MCFVIAHASPHGADLVPYETGRVLRRSAVYLAAFVTQFPVRRFAVTPRETFGLCKPSVASLADCPPSEKRNKNWSATACLSLLCPFNRDLSKRETRKKNSNQAKYTHGVETVMVFHTRKLAVRDCKRVFVSRRPPNKWCTVCYHYPSCVLSAFVQGRLRQKKKYLDTFDWHGFPHRLARLNHVY